MSTPEPPVTADHTPERLSAEDREALEAITDNHALLNADDVCVSCHVAGAVKRILAAHLADVEARLARAPRVEITQSQDSPARCKVWRGDVLVFNGQDASAALHSGPERGGPR